MGGRKVTNTTRISEEEKLPGFWAYFGWRNKGEG